MRQSPSGSARLDLGGVYFSTSAPGPFPVTLEPHLLVLVRCPADHKGMGALVVKFMRPGAAGELEMIVTTADYVKQEYGKRVEEGLKLLAQFQPRLPIQIPLVHFHQRQAKEGRLKIVTVSLTGIVRKSHSGGKDDSGKSQRAASGDHGRFQHRHLISHYHLVIAGNRSRQIIRQGNGG